mgnify:CR=1 FL=1
MRKFLMGTVFAAIMLCGAATQAQWVDKLALYVPNRILDILDTFTLNIGVGPTLRAELRATHAFQFGAGAGITAKAIKDINRQYGGALENGWRWSFSCIRGASYERRNHTRWVEPYFIDDIGFPSPMARYFDYHKGAIDYWEFGGTLGAGLVEVDLSIHPIEMVDAVLGLVLIDIKGDDLTFESFQ